MKTTSKATITIAMTAAMATIYSIGSDPSPVPVGVTSGDSSGGEVPEESETSG